MRHTSSSRHISVCLISGHAIVLQELQRILHDAPVAVNSLKLSSEQNTCETLAPTDCYVIDSAGLPESGSQVVEQIIRAKPDANILVLSDSVVPQSAFPLLRLGVRGLITHDMIEQQLIPALDAVSTGGYWVPRTLLASFVESVVSRERKTHRFKPAAVEVSRREKDILDGLLQNLSNKEIAGKFNISERTVKFHVSNLLTKFKVRRRADLILLWYQQGGQRSGYDREVSTSDPRIQ